MAQLALENIYGTLAPKLKRDRIIIGIGAAAMLIALIMKFGLGYDIGLLGYFAGPLFVVNALIFFFYGAMSKARFLAEAHKQGYLRNEAEQFWNTKRG